MIRLMQTGNSSDKHQKKNAKHTRNHKLEEYWANSKENEVPAYCQERPCVPGTEDGNSMDPVLFS